MTKTPRNKRHELSQQKPLPLQLLLRVMHAMLKAKPEQIERFVHTSIDYATARQLCHAFDIKCIKGNCRKVLARRVIRITTLPQNAELEAQLLEATAPKEVQNA